MTVVWIALVVALVVMLGIFAVVLFRKFIRLLGAFSDLVGQTAVLDGVHRAEPEERAVPAVLGGLAAASGHWGDVGHRRRERRATRRAARLSRARLLVSADVTSANANAISTMRFSR